MNYQVKHVLKKLKPAEMPELPAPAYANPHAEHHNIALAVESMKRHMTNEGWQIMDALQSAGYSLYGWGLPNGITNVEKIVEDAAPTTVVVQDKREWDRNRRSFRDKMAHFEEIDTLRKYKDVFKLTILKDAQNDPHYHMSSADEIGCHAWIVYYNEQIVKHLAPYVRRKHLIRTYHSINLDEMPNRIDFSTKNGALLSGAISSAYPLRTLIHKYRLDFPWMQYKKHPGYHMNGCETPDFLQQLASYKVSICTASKFGYALRKIIESTACGCVVITDLPEDEVLPGIDENLLRVNPDEPMPHLLIRIKELITRAMDTYDAGRQLHLAGMACRMYNHISIGAKLAADIEQMRLGY